MPKQSWKLTRKQKRQLVEARRKGKKLDELVEMFGINRSCVQYHCARANVEPMWRGNGHSKLDQASARQIRLMVMDEGMTRRATADIFGVSHSMVSRIVRGREWPYAGGPIDGAIPWSDRHCPRCTLLLPEYHKGPLCQLCGRGE